MSKSLERSADPGALFTNAIAFWDAANFVGEAQKRGEESGKLNLNLSTPQTALLAFTCELFLKCISAIERNGRYSQGHDLETLFKELSKDARAYISEMFAGLRTLKANASSSSPNTGKLEIDWSHDALKAIGNFKAAFVELRYFPSEFPVLFTSNEGIVEFTDATRIYIRKIRPDWFDPKTGAPLRGEVDVPRKTTSELRPD